MSPVSTAMLVGGWVVAACFLSGAIAAGLDMPSLWGGGAVFFEYALPLPFGWGLMHVPGLALFGALLAATTRQPHRWGAATRLCALGTLGGVVAIYLLIEAARGLPLNLYLAVDALTAYAATVLVPGTAENPWSRRARQLMLCGPGAIVLLAVLAAPLILPRYRVSMTDTVPASNGESLRVFAVLQGRRSDPQDECEGLARLAEDYRHRFTQRGGDTPMDGEVLLFTDARDIRRSNASSAWVRYRFSHTSADHCSAGNI